MENTLSQRQGNNHDPDGLHTGDSRKYLLRDITIVALFIVCLVLANFLGLLLARGISLVVEHGQYTGLVLRRLTSGLGQVGCGYLLGRCLAGVNPWKVFTVLAVLICLVTGTNIWFLNSASAAQILQIPLWQLVFDEVMVATSLLAFVALGIWIGKRHPGRRFSAS